ncbi:hypothetical protein CTAYLR_008960 [Chrysophaeum taylorii]|uniref:PPPDE domain-containing protein n=1 Tax=Chrysophaeum taylorii TaxID=2483200 RepID=A0AAD7UMF6_9STRA|nr:hypothetical protein CTAYLR_008960 [Chrysophaeum taylorii]
MSERQVTLHIYEFVDVGDRLNSVLGSLNVGVYHTGVEVSGFEYSFNDKGVFRSRPRRLGPECRHKESLVLGTFVGSANELTGAVNELRAEFRPGTYSLVQRNCNHFSDALARKLAGVGVPAHINRAAALAGVFSSKAFQVEGEEQLSVEKPPSSSSSSSSSSSWWWFSSETAADQQQKTKRKELTLKQRELLAKMRTTS